VTLARWTEVDRYLTELLVESDEALDAARAGELPAIEVTPTQGKLLHLLARVHGARTVLELGTLGGYSTLWLVRALPADGRVVTIEVDARHAEVAARVFTGAGVDDRVELIVGDALDVLPTLTGPFDLIFIDADKPRNPQYLEWALRLSRPGTLIVADNVVRDGEVADADSNDPRVQGVRRFYELVAAEPRLTATAIQTVGSKGYDGFALALVT
jgi:predicted O-methyltransferase YrrM